MAPIQHKALINCDMGEAVSKIQGCSVWQNYDVDAFDSMATGPADPISNSSPWSILPILPAASTAVIPSS